MCNTYQTNIDIMLSNLLRFVVIYNINLVSDYVFNINNILFSTYNIQPRVKYNGPSKHTPYHLSEAGTNWPPFSLISHSCWPWVSCRSYQGLTINFCYFVNSWSIRSESFLIILKLYLFTATQSIMLFFYFISFGAKLCEVLKIIRVQVW